jgi:hypothetical protein
MQAPANLREAIMTDASLGRPASKADFVAVPHWRVREVPRRSSSKRSSWRYIPLLTIGLGGALLVAMALMPASEPSLPLRPAIGETSDNRMADALADFEEHEPAQPAVLPAWVQIPQPLALYDLPAPELAGLSRDHAAARHTTGGGRDDVLTFGAFDTDAPYLRLSIYQAGTEAPPPASFFVDLVRRAGEADLAVPRSAVAHPLVTKFGAVEVADTVLDHNGRERACLAFRYLGEAATLRLSGWFCGAAAAPADRVRLACLFDRLDLVAAGANPGLATLFAQAEQKRGEACADARIKVGARRTSWLDAGGTLPNWKNGAEAKAGGTAARRNR